MSKVLVISPSMRDLPSPSRHRKVPLVLAVLMLEVKSGQRLVQLLLRVRALLRVGLSAALLAGPWLRFLHSSAGIFRLKQESRESPLRKQADMPQQLALWLRLPLMLPSTRLLLESSPALAWHWMQLSLASLRRSRKQRLREPLLNPLQNPLSRLLRLASPTPRSFLISALKSKMNC